MPDKLILLHRGALLAKYGQAGLEQIISAIDRLVEADRDVRRLTTRVVELDNPAHCAAPVRDRKSDYQFKRAVDACCESAPPDYVVLVGGPDCFPFYRLRNPIDGDDFGERDVPSDLPYASRSERRRDVVGYLDCERVVGRLPDILGAADPGFLVALINAAAEHRSLPVDRFTTGPFCLSAEAWEASTQESVDAIFDRRNPPVVTSPPVYEAGLGAGPEALMHFVNCHGTVLYGAFEGEGLHRQRAAGPALTSDLVGALPRASRVVAAECCYGAALFDPAREVEKPGRLPVPNAYFVAGAAAFLGSTKIAYGPAVGNGAADLITQWFLRSVLLGRSVGASLLRARQRFVSDEDMLDPVNLKTLGQFVLFGDPSLVPVEASAAVPNQKTVVDHEMLRRERRLTYQRKAAILGEYGVRFVRSPLDPGDAIRSQLEDVASKEKLKVTAAKLLSVEGPVAVASGGKSGTSPTPAIALVSCQRADGAGQMGASEAAEIIVAKLVNNAISSFVHDVPRSARDVGRRQA